MAKDGSLLGVSRWTGPLCWEGFCARNLDMTGECWLWRWRLHKSGYAYAWFNGREGRLHRLVYEHLVGPLNGLHLHHDCPNLHCCNPEHLIPMTQADHMRECHRG